MTEQNLREKIQNLIERYKDSAAAEFLKHAFTEEEASYYSGILMQLNSTVDDLETILKDDN